MIVTYPNYLDQTQTIGLPSIIEYHGSAIPPEYIRRLTIENQKPTYRLKTSSALTTDIILSPSNTLYPSDTLYPNGKKYYTIRISEGS